MNESIGERILGRLNGTRNPLWYLNYGVGNAALTPVPEITEEEAYTAVRVWKKAYND